MSICLSTQNFSLSSIPETSCLRAQSSVSLNFEELIESVSQNRNARVREALLSFVSFLLAALVGTVLSLPLQRRLRHGVLTALRMRKGRTGVGAASGMIFRP